MKSDLFDNAKDEFIQDQEDIRRDRLIAEAMTSDDGWSTDKHRAYILRPRSKSAKNYPLIQRRLVINPAFLALSGAAVKLLILCHEAVWWDDNQPKRTTKRKYGGGKPGSFEMSYGRAIAAGVAASSATVSKAFKELIAFKFISKGQPKLGTPNTYRLAMGYRKISEKKALEISESLKRPLQNLKRTTSKFKVVSSQK